MIQFDSCVFGGMVWNHQLDVLGWWFLVGKGDGAVIAFHHLRAKFATENI